MTPQELKNSILQLAIQGKLVEQRPEEGTAEELFAWIQEEKQRLIAEKKIKKEKPLPEITEDEKPFDIPESWKWVRLGELFQHNTGKALNSTNRIGVCLKYITTSNLYWNRFELEHLREMFFTDSEIEKCTAQKGDLLVCEGGDIGRAAIWQNDETICIQNHIHAFKYVDIPEEDASKYWLRNNDLLIQRSNSRELVGTSCIYTGADNAYIYPDLMMRMRVLNGVDVQYIDYVLKSPMTRNYYMASASGTSESMPKINQKIVSFTLVPLPSLAEQKRIVEKLEQLLPLCERLK